MKTAMFAAIVTLFLGVSAGAQNVRTLPSLCKPCIFYGGDFNVNDPNSNSFADGNTLTVSDTAIYAAVDVPKNVTGVITGILFMQLSTLIGNDIFDPATAPYDIRIGVAEGNGGTSVASGINTLSYAPYMNVFDFEIYQTALNLTGPFRVTPGTRYWFTVVPQCTNSGNSNCSVVRYFLPNTTQQTNGLHAAAQPADQMFWNSAFFGFNWKNVCDEEGSPSCARASFGLMGHR